MSRIDRSRRLAVLLLVVLGLLLVPSVAVARFTSGATGSLPVGTDRMETPTAVSGTYRCSTLLVAERLDVSVDSFADAGPRGATYEFTIGGHGPGRTVTSGDRSAAVSSGYVASDGHATEWTFTLRARIGNWTSGPYTRTITCGIFGGAGTL